MNISRQIKKFREREGFSQEALAEKIYVSRQTISNWENEKSYPDIHNLLLLSVLFGVSLDELVKGDLDAMKKEVEKNRLGFWGKGMLVFMVLTPVSIAPAFKFLGLAGLLIPLTFAVAMMLSAIKVESIKKKHNVYTYSEILAYMEGKDAPGEKIQQEKKHKTRNTILLMAGSGALALVLAALGFFLFRL